MSESKRDPTAALPSCTRQGEYAILCDAGVSTDQTLDLDIQRKIWAVSAFLSDQEDVLEIVPGMNNLLVVFRHIQHDVDAAQTIIHKAWQQTRADVHDSRQVTVPVVYGGRYGQDLEFVARHAGLTPQEYVDRHARVTYVVYALGSQPGFAYLGGLDPKLAVPRRNIPRPKVDAGSVIIGGSQAGILSRTTPSGWHIIGTTELNCFDHTSERAALFAPGDTVRFQAKEIFG